MLFRSRFLRIRSRLGALFEPQRVLFSILLKASYARKAGGSAICKKHEGNSLAALPIVYLFFIIYSKSTVGQLTKLKFLWKLCQYDRYKHQPTPYQFSLAQILMQNQKASDHRGHGFQTKDQRCYRRIHILLPHDL